jgi:hypothetical protein
LLGAVADPEPAKSACEELADSFCERTIECGLASDKERCVASSVEVLSCARALGYQLNFETCLDDIEKADCTALTMPASCDSVIVRARVVGSDY